MTSWRKREYGKHLIKLASKCLNKDYIFDNQKLGEEDQFLFKHIVEANSLDDLQK